MKKLIMLAIVLGLLVGGCNNITRPHTQYIVFKDRKVLIPFAKIDYNVKQETVTAKVIVYQKHYTGVSGDSPGYMSFKMVEGAPDFEKLKDCVVVDNSNWEGYLPSIRSTIKMVDGKFVMPPRDGDSFFISVNWWTWWTMDSNWQEWVAGTKSPTHEHVVASTKVGQWIPEEGYEWANPGPPPRLQSKKEANC